MRSVLHRAFAASLIVAVLLLTPVLISKASACPFCDGGPSGVNQVKEDIFDHHFWPRVAATLAPFPVLIGIVGLIYFGPPRLR
jgi:hypothetical protein